MKEHINFLLLRATTLPWQQHWKQTGIIIWQHEAK